METKTGLATISEKKVQKLSLEQYRFKRYTGFYLKVPYWYLKGTYWYLKCTFYYLKDTEVYPLKINHPNGSFRAFFVCVFLRVYIQDSLCSIASTLKGIAHEKRMQSFTHSPFPCEVSTIQVHLNKLECCGKVHLFSNFTQICETRVLNKLSAHRLK